MFLSFWALSLWEGLRWVGWHIEVDTLGLVEQLKGDADVVTNDTPTSSTRAQTRKQTQRSLPYRLLPKYNPNAGKVGLSRYDGPAEGLQVATGGNGVVATPADTP